MQTPEGETRHERDSGGSTWPLWLLLAAAILTLVVVRSRRPARPEEFVGLPLPPIEAAAWLNVDRPPARGELAGRVVLVDYWFVDCGYCRQAMPELARIRDAFRDQDLVVIGFTPDPLEERPRVEDYVQSVPGFDWPVGLGARMAVEALGIRMYPTYILYDRSGQSVWGGSRLTGVEDEILAALARPAPASR